MLKKIHPQDRLRVEGSGIRVVWGGTVGGLIEEVTYEFHKPEIRFMQVPGNSKVELQFLLSGDGEATFTYESLEADRVSRSVTLK